MQDACVCVCVCPVQFFSQYRSLESGENKLHSPGDLFYVTCSEGVYLVCVCQGWHLDLWTCQTALELGGCAIQIVPF